MKKLLCLDNVTYNYYTIEGETKALDNVSFCLDDGEFLSIVGPSGCGKTTLLSLISGLYKVTHGKIHFLDGDEKHRNIGYMLQRDQLFEWRTIRQNVLLGLEIQKKMTPENIAYADSLIEKYGLKDFAKYYPRQLSGGMRQRAALIRTLALQPSLLLLDEAFSALDYQTRINVCDDVYRIIKEEKKTAILVTHDISEAISLSDRILVLTQRPASIKAEYIIDLKAPTPLARRENPKFSAYFDKIWHDLH